MIHFMWSGREYNYLFLSLEAWLHFFYIFLLECFHLMSSCHLKLWHSDLPKQGTLSNCYRFTSLMSFQNSKCGELFLFHKLWMVFLNELSNFLLLLNQHFHSFPRVSLISRLSLNSSLGIRSLLSHLMNIC